MITISYSLRKSTKKNKECKRQRKGILARARIRRRMHAHATTAIGRYPALERQSISSHSFYHLGEERCISSCVVKAHPSETAEVVRAISFAKGDEANRLVRTPTGTLPSRPCVYAYFPIRKISTKHEATNKRRGNPLLLLFTY